MKLPYALQVGTPFSKLEGGNHVKTPGGGKSPGMQKSQGSFKSPQKPQQKPVNKMQDKPAYKPSPKPEHRPEQKPFRKPEQKPPRKPERDPGAKKRIALFDMLKNRQGTQQADNTTDISGEGSTTTASTSGGRRSCCLGCAVYALAVPMAAVLLAVIS